MIAAQLPMELRDLLSGAACESGTLRFVDAVETVLLDNKTPFFPAYTDHGAEHVTRVIAACVRLVPHDVWQRETLRPEDASVVVCASLLHDIAMHFREHSFVSLVKPDSLYPPAPWFDRPTTSRPGDRDWFSLWQTFRHEARHFNQTRLDRILGPGHDGPPAIAFGDHDLDPSAWTSSDRLLVGEFLRRHHARLAHEIALHGLPNVSHDLFPALSTLLPRLATPIGVAARSHNEALRAMVDYCAFSQPGNMRPWGVVLPYLMGLLRIADYLQLDADRAPVLLLHLRDPPSLASVEEWSVHGAVASISWETQDPMAIYIEADTGHGIRTHLQLTELVATLQREFDATAAVLSEVYSVAPLLHLRLNRQRVRTNLNEPALHNELAYVPRRTALRSDEDLFRLLIGDLYGERPPIALRELLQNALDAVRERWRWEAEQELLPRTRFRPCPADVAVYVEHHGNGDMLLRVVDTGLGMSADIVDNYYLKAGGSLDPSPVDSEGVSRESAARWMKAGRFGIGAFAGFLLGSRIEVRTRRVGDARGLAFTASLDGDLVELRHVDVPLGTEVTIPFHADILPDEETNEGWLEPEARYVLSASELYWMDKPTARFFFVNAAGESTEITRDAGGVPLPGDNLPTMWRAVDAPPQFDAVLWSVSRTRAGSVIHNGIEVRRFGDADDEDEQLEPRYDWCRSNSGSGIGWHGLSRPAIAVFDSQHKLGLTLDRFALKEAALPFERELLESIGVDVVAWALTGALGPYPLALGWMLRPVCTASGWLPLLPTMISEVCHDDICVMWTGLASLGSRGVHNVPWADGFVRQLTDSAWAPLGVRAVLPAFSHGGIHTGDERAPWIADLDRIRASAGDLCALLGRTSVALVVVRSGGREQRAADWEELRDGESGYWLPRKVASVGAQTHHALVSRDRWLHQRDNCAEGLALEAAGRLAQGGRTVALSLLRRGQQPNDDYGVVSSAWMQNVAGVVPWDPAERISMKTSLLKGTTGVARAIRSWELIGEADRRSEGPASS